MAFQLLHNYMGSILVFTHSHEFEKNEILSHGHFVLHENHQHKFK